MRLEGFQPRRPTATMQHKHKSVPLRALGWPSIRAAAGRRLHLALALADRGRRRSV
jgi:hypothetical protein